MTDPLPHWPRPHLQPGGYDAHLLYKVHGDFDGSLRVSRSKHRCGGVPDGLQLSFYQGLPEWTCETRGDLQDPDFNNLHIDVRLSG